MIIRRRCSVIILMLALFIIVLLVNMYFVYVIMEEKVIPEEEERHLTVSTTTVTSKRLKQNQGYKASSKVQLKQRKYYINHGNLQRSATLKSSQKIQKVVTTLDSKYRNISLGYKGILAQVLSDLNPAVSISKELWNIAANWVTSTEIIPESVPLLGSVLNTLCSTKIIKADNTRKGTQLKLLLTLEGDQQALFKPQWYTREEVVGGPVYAGRDRHNAEVAAFHLSLLLNFRRVPLTVGRKVNLRREIMPVATPSLIETFYQEGNNTCFYGVCMYCEPQSPVCAKQDIMEGAVILWLPAAFKFQRYPSPWQRTYKNELIARWEVEENFCTKVKNTKQYSLDNSPRLLDLVDAAVFDFLLDNGDRHHYEVPSNSEPASVFLFDNGKSFGNPHVDHIDILAPLYQCCVIRESTWERLKIFGGGALSSSLEQTLKYSHIAPVLTIAHLHALDRRLLTVYAAVEICITENGINQVIV